MFMFWYWYVAAHGSGDGKGTKKPKNAPETQRAGGGPAAGTEGEGLSKAEKRRRQRENRKVQTAAAGPSTYSPPRPNACRYCCAQAKFQRKDGDEDKQLAGDADSQCALVWANFMAAGGDKLSDLELEPIKFGACQLIINGRASCVHVSRPAHQPTDAAAFMDPPSPFLGNRRELAHLRAFIKV
jgi:hypothetical protein